MFIPGTFPMSPGRGEGACGVSFIRVLIAFMTASASKPNHLSKAPLTHFITSGALGYQHTNLGKDTNTHILTMNYASGVIAKKSVPDSKSQRFPPVVSSKILIVVALRFRSMIHLS